MYNTEVSMRLLTAVSQDFFFFNQEVMTSGEYIIVLTNKQNIGYKDIVFKMCL